MASLFLDRPGSDREWGECNTPQGPHRPWAEPWLAGLFLLLTIRLGLSLLGDGGQAPSFTL